MWKIIFERVKSRAVAQWAEFLGKLVLLSMEIRYFFALYSIKTVDRSCSRKCGNGMIHCRRRESVSLSFEIRVSA